MPITPYLEGRRFDDEAVRRMGDAFNRAQQLLRDKGQPPVVRGLIANAIIEIASAGERDVDELALQGLKALGIGLDNIA
jgi:hypothetical protein